MCAAATDVPESVFVAVLLVIQSEMMFCPGAQMSTIRSVVSTAQLGM